MEWFINHKINNWYRKLILLYFWINTFNFLPPLPDKIISNERPHGKEARYGGALVGEDVHVHGVVLGDLHPGGQPQLVRRVTQEGQVGQGADQDQHIRRLQTWTKYE